jgi:hypothetical protein
MESLAGALVVVAEELRHQLSGTGIRIDHGHAYCEGGTMKTDFIPV